MEGIKVVRFALIVAVFAVAWVTQCGAAPKMDIEPADSVHEVGDNAKLSCKILAKPEVEAMVWSRTIRGGSLEVIYKTHLPDPIDSTKYDFVNMNLTDALESYIIVKNLQYADAGMYKCNPMTSQATGRDAHLVVVGKPIISMPSRLIEEKLMLFICDIMYEGTIAHKAANLQPELFALLGDDNISTANVEVAELSDDITRLRLVYNVTAQTFHDGMNFTCGARVKRGTPTPVDFEISKDETLDVAYGVRDVKIVEPQEVYYPGDFISCTGAGNPRPELKWSQVDSAGGVPEQHNGVLTVDKYMIGSNTWKCTGQNKPEGTAIEMASTTHKFEVFEADDPAAGETTGGDSTTIAIAVAVPIGVLLVIAIVVCIVCFKKKSNAKPKPAEGEATTKTTRDRNQIYKPVSTKQEGQVSFKDDKTASYQPDQGADATDGKPMAAQRSRVKQMEV